jgi:CheY-like chemotaxis protein
MARKVLVVDDDKDVRDLIRLLLEGDGFEVCTATGGHQALEYLRALRPDPPELLITDVLMPEGDGYELLKALPSVAPRTKTLVISGGGMLTPGQYLETAQLPCVGTVLRKPFTRAEFLDSIHSVLSPTMTPST